VARKTEGVRELVLRALQSVSAPDQSNVIDQVAAEIQGHYRTEYDALCSKLTRDVVNNWIGRWTKDVLGRSTIEQVPARLSTIIGSFTLLK
jgi:hypothetical protein